jgi:hypothetical protein
MATLVGSLKVNANFFWVHNDVDTQIWSKQLVQEVYAAVLKFS